jgi:enoyl-CoA hydratase/carnithine racemase
LELAASCHIRVADDTTFYALPEGTRGIFVGGGGAVRIPKLIGVARMTDMMMTGRVYNAVDGERIGFAQYLVSTGTAFDKALELAQRIATNAPLTNYALMHALPRIAEQAADHGFVTESLMSSITQAAPEAKARVDAFLQGRAAAAAQLHQARVGARAWLSVARPRGPGAQAPAPRAPAPQLLLWPAAHEPPAARQPAAKR